MEMRTVHSLTSGMTRRQINGVMESGTHAKRNGEIKIQLGQISCVYNPRNLAESLISAVSIATTYREDIDKQNEARKLSSIISNDRQFRCNAQGPGKTLEYHTDTLLSKVKSKLGNTFANLYT
jgi:hypothetical protein